MEEGMTKDKPQKLTNWLGHEWTPESQDKAAHPNSRYTVPASQCPVIDPDWENPKGVPISAILFGGRRATTIPLVYEALNWSHGTFMGSIVSSEKTAAAAGKIGEVRHDPFAMLPFCGYNMGDYFAHWLNIGKNAQEEKLPRIFYVNWFRKNRNGEFIWPGYSDNIRVLKWILERVSGSNNAIKTPIGYLPKENAINLNELYINKEDFKSILSINKKEWMEEALEIENYYKKFGDTLPQELAAELSGLKERLNNYKD